EVIAAARLTDLAGPFAVPAQAVNGADVDAVAAAAGEAVAAIRSEQGPRFLELRCVRMGPHSTLTREERHATEIQGFDEHDPLRIYERGLREDGVLDEDLLSRMRADVNAEIAAAERFAAAAQWPDPQAALLDV
ncbi:MAG TPA: thiamine pyrophosphate-dependent enzyme, partial [Steroidobacteraceae bacterium]